MIAIDVHDNVQSFPFLFQRPHNPVQYGSKYNVYLQKKSGYYTLRRQNISLSALIKSLNHDYKHGKYKFKIAAYVLCLSLIAGCNNILKMFLMRLIKRNKPTILYFLKKSSSI